ncbi:MAG: pyrimidine-nucleoside phosphorylase [Clostridia bacterium]|nr:pyrimidine-nucleoside phosphorylase [Clostridia bacterium]
MRIFDIIAKKRDGGELTKEEIEFFIQGYTAGAIEDYQASALVMAIYINGMSKRETADLTLAMAHSGDMADLSGINGVKVDKHSTGGVGDKTTMVVAPLVASFGVPVAKMSGRGLGHTGGTIDKLESIRGFQTAMPIEKFIENVNTIHIAVVGQTGDLAPADKKLYALRDVTATISSIPLIASSIMSKKIAGGADAIVLDVKFGDGAFMKTLEDAKTLAKAMVDIGEMVGRKTVAVISNMNEPLGLAIGNALEVEEAVATLKGNGPRDFETVCVELAAQMLCLAGKGSTDTLKEELHTRLQNGVAFEKFKEFVAAQGGDVSVIENLDLLPSAESVEPIYAKKSGYINKIEAEKLGIASMLLGGGRAKKTDLIDYGVGIILNKKVADFVNVGDKIADLYVNDRSKLADAVSLIDEAFSYQEERLEEETLIAGIIRGDEN